MSWKSFYYPLGSHFLYLEDILYIEEALKSFPLETVTYGDAGELNNCRVGRLVEDHPCQSPKVVNKELSEPILKLFSSTKARSFYSKYVGEVSDGQVIRRCQFNLLDTGAFVGRHLDVDSNPDYQIASVLQLGSSFEGGEFAVYENPNSHISEAQVIKPEFGSITISFCKHEHEVLPVSSGVRTSFVAFVSSYGGRNRRTLSS